MKDSIVRERDLLALDGLPTSTRNDLIRAGAYPKPYRLGPRCKGWKMSEVQAWIKALPRAEEVEAA